MISYLLKIWVLLLFSAVIIYNYYWNKAHIENFDWYSIYFFIIIFFYVIYKTFQVNSLKDKVIFTPIKIFWYFFVHLILLSTLFFYYNNSLFAEAFWNWIALKYYFIVYCQY